MLFFRCILTDHLFRTFGCYVHPIFWTTGESVRIGAFVCITVCVFYCFPYTYIYRRYIIYTYQQIGHSCDSISFMCALCFSVALCVCIIFAFLFPIQSPHRMNGDDGDDCDDDDVGNATKATMYAVWLCLCMCTELYDTLYRGYSCRSSVLRMRKRFAIIESPV